jgi:predicted phage baseplate assembly protein
VYANVAAVTRGETVPNETLGIGNAALTNQRFKLKKKPLTYVSAPTSADASGVRSTLTIWVRDIAWREVPSFFGSAADAQIFIVRQDDDGESWIIFGDGVRGARLPAGASVVARYRFGAGAASPPAAGITQIAKPVKGLTAVRNPVPAAGGSDRETAAQVRSYAPRSALLFGRAVSIKDMEALAAGQPGVQAVQAQWTWNASLQQPAVQIWYIGPASISAALTQSLRAATAPSTPIAANPAQAVAASLALEVRVDRRYQLPLVQAAVTTQLTAAGTGLLSPERIGIGVPLFRSHILAEALAVEGVSTLGGLLWQGAPFAEYGITPGEGAWFDVSLTVNVTEDQHG